jgi:hypothetical protein
MACRLDVENVTVAGISDLLAGVPVGFKHAKSVYPLDFSRVLCQKLQQLGAGGDRDPGPNIRAGQKIVLDGLHLNLDDGIFWR